MARKYEKIKFAKTAYITFACLIVALIVMIILLIPSSHDKLTANFTGSYEVESKNQGEEPTTEYYAIGDDHVLAKMSFGKFKRTIKKDQYTFVLFGNGDDKDFRLEAIEINKAAKEKGIEKVYFLDSNDLDEDDLEYIRTYLRPINENAKSVTLMPTLDLWAFSNDKMLNAMSIDLYESMNTYTKAYYKIFR